MWLSVLFLRLAYKMTQPKANYVGTFSLLTEFLKRHQQLSRVQRAHRLASLVFLGTAPLTFSFAFLSVIGLSDSLCFNGIAHLLKSSILHPPLSIRFNNEMQRNYTTAHAQWKVMTTRMAIVS